MEAVGHGPDADEPVNTSHAEMLVVLGLAVAAASAIKVPGAVLGTAVNALNSTVDFRDGPARMNLRE